MPNFHLLKRIFATTVIQLRRFKIFFTIFPYDELKSDDFFLHLLCICYIIFVISTLIHKEHKL